MSNKAVGVDFGSSRMVIAIVNKGGVEIVSNEATYRATPTLTSYGN